MRRPSGRPSRDTSENARIRVEILRKLGRHPKSGQHTWGIIERSQVSVDTSGDRETIRSTQTLLGNLEVLPGLSTSLDTPF